MFNTPPMSPDVTANRASQFTDSQRKRLQNRLWGFGLGALLFLALPVLMLIVLGAELISGGAAEFGSEAWFSIGCLGLIGLGLLGLSAWFGWQLLQTWQDLSEGRIEQGDGQVAWRRSRYRADMEGRALSMAEVSLGPGPYRFYYLPRTRRILSAEKLALGAGGTADDELRAALAQANGFRLDALTDLRSGRIGEMRGGLLRSAWVAAGLMSVALGGFMAFVILLAFRERSTDSQIFILFAAVFILAVIVAMIWGAVNVTRDVMEDRVLTAQGLVRRQVHRSNKSTSYYYVLDRLRFSVSGAAYNALVEGRVYRLYYLPRAKKLIGIEPAES